MIHFRKKQPILEEDDFDSLTSTINELNDLNTFKNINEPQIFIPNKYSDVPLIAKEYMKTKCVKVDFSNINKSEGKRVVDFLTGVMFAIDGTFEKIDTNIYLFNAQK